ncbi:hypothetical protein Q4I28_005613 [Leishmania naiffi]|uniref:Uncharacterized protein n=1 Tax=Leishmania naiffi TaxID=5678 RepID=A0AAW3BHG8_9TRYP
MLDALHGTEGQLVGDRKFTRFSCRDGRWTATACAAAAEPFVPIDLETAIDCLNVSRKAYAVHESCGDEFIHTDIQVGAMEVPRAALRLAECLAMKLLSLCFRPPPHTGHVLTDSTEDDAAAAAISPTSGDDMAPLLCERRAPLCPFPAPVPPSATVAFSEARAAQADPAAVTAPHHRSSSIAGVGFW